MFSGEHCVVLIACILLCKTNFDRTA